MLSHKKKKNVKADSEDTQSLIKKMLSYPSFKRMVHSHEPDGDEYVFKLKPDQPMVVIGSAGFPSMLKLIENSGYTLVVESRNKILMLYLREA